MRQQPFVRAYLARLLLTAVSFPALADTGPATEATLEAGQTELRDRIEEVLRGASPEALGSLGPDALPLVFDLMLQCAGSTGASEPDGRCATLYDGLASFESTAVVDELRRRMPQAADPHACSVYLGALELFGRPTEIEPALAMCAALPAGDRANPVNAFERAVTRILEREPLGVKALARPLVLADPDLALALARAVAASPSPSAVAVLAAVLGQRPEIELSLLSLIARAADHAERPVGSGVCTAVRTHLLAGDFQLRREAAHAVGQLGDFDSAELLIDMLSAEEEALRATGLWGLRKMFGMEFGLDPARWQLWLRTEKEWFQTRASVSLELVQGDEVPVVLAALDDLRIHRYRRFEVARQVEPLLAHRAESVCARACAVLQDLAPELPHPAHEPCSIEAGAALETAVASE